jgi:hypothetical protein
MNFDRAIAIGGFVTDEEFLAALLKCDRRDGAKPPLLNYAEETRERHLNQLLDQALDESFPASDSPSVGNSS